MTESQAWKEFEEAGMLWWLNRILHTLGWVIVIEVDEDTEEILRAYSKRTEHRMLDFPREVALEKWREFHKEMQR